MKFATKGKFQVAVLIASLGAWVPGASAQQLSGLYTMLQYSQRTFVPTYWFFLPDGRYLNTLPAGELTVSGMERTCGERPMMCGHYTVSGGKLNLTPNQGQPRSMDFQMASADQVTINHTQAIHVQPLPRGTVLDGRYEMAKSLGSRVETTVGGASQTMLSVARDYTFRRDGTLSANSQGHVFISGEPSAHGSGFDQNQGAYSSAQGTYSISGNTLYLSLNGQKSSHIIYFINGGGSSMLYIDGDYWKKL